MKLSRFQAGPAQYATLAAALALLVLAAGFITQQSWAAGLWPWAERDLTYVFLGAVLAAMAAGLGRVGFAAEWGPLAAGALNLFIAASGAAYFLFQATVRKGQPDLRLHAWAAVAVAVVGALVFVWAQSRPECD